jgi:hypothetical protein
MSKFMSSLDELSQEWLGQLLEHFGPITNGWLHKDFAAADLLTQSKIPCVPFWSYGERLAVLTEPKPTPLQIAYGVLENPDLRLRAFFCLRDSSVHDAIPEPVRSQTFVDGDPTLAKRMAELKDRIRRSQFPILDGHPARWDPDAFDRPTRSQGRLVGLEEFGAWVLDHLWEGLRAQLELPTGESAAESADPEADMLPLEHAGRLSGAERRTRGAAGSRTIGMRTFGDPRSRGHPDAVSSLPTARGEAGGFADHPSTNG